MVNTKKFGGAKTPTTEEEDRDTNLAAANEIINPIDSVKEEEEDDMRVLGELDNAMEEEIREWRKALDMRVAALEEKDVNAKNIMEALDMRVASLVEKDDMRVAVLEEKDDMRVAALEEKYVNGKNIMEALDMRVASLVGKDVDGKNKLEALDMRITALEAYFEKVGEQQDND